MMSSELILYLGFALVVWHCFYPNGILNPFGNINHAMKEYLLVIKKPYLHSHIQKVSELLEELLEFSILLYLRCCYLHH